MNRYPNTRTLFFGVAISIVSAATAQAKMQCEKSTVSGIGYAQTQTNAEDNATQAWRDSAKTTFDDAFKIKDAKITSKLRCNRNRRAVRRVVSARTTDPVIIGRRTRKWICDISAKPCLESYQDETEEAAIPDGKKWKKAQKRLANRGFEYAQVKIFTACKHNKLFEMEVMEGRQMFRTKKKIGECPYGGPSVEDVKEDLKRFGYSYVVINRTASGFSGKACLKADYFKLTADRWADHTRKTNIGECPHGGLSRKEVRKLLADDDYTAVKFIDNTPPNYKVRACRDGDSYVMNIDRNGRIHGSYSDKRCGNAGYSLSRIRSNLNRADYKDIEFVDRKLPRYVAEVCQDRNRLSLTMNRWGEVSRQRKIGRCRRGVRVNQDQYVSPWKKAAKVLETSGYHKISYRSTNKNTREHFFSACKGPKAYKLTVKRGEIVARRRRRGLSFLECIVN